MGASGWDYSVAYQPDVAVALEQLRREVYARGEYYREEPNPAYALTEEQFKATLPPDDGSGINEFLLEDWRAAQQRPQPVDPDTLLAAQPDSGTHSIIDMCNGRSDEPALFTVSPLTVEQTLDFFGTLTATPDQVEQWLTELDLSTIRARWQGVYVISYTGGRPDRIHFAGFSGD